LALTSWSALVGLAQTLTYKPTYVSLFILILIEESGCPLPLPGEWQLIRAGAQVMSGQMQPLYVFLAVVPASAIGCSILYFLARTGGRAAIARFGHLVRLDEARLNKLESRVRRLGPPAVLIGRVTPGMRLPTDIAAGVFGVPFRYYLSLAMVATCLRITFFLFLGPVWQRLWILLAPTRDTRFMLPLAAAIALLLAVHYGWLKRPIAALRKTLAAERPPIWVRYAVALVLTSAAISLAYFLPSLAPGKSWALLLLAAVLVSAHAGGFGPGLLSSIVSGAAGTYLFLPPILSWHVAARTDIALLTGFAILGVIASGLMHWSTRTFGDKPQTT